MPQFPVCTVIAGRGPLRPLPGLKSYDLGPLFQPPFGLFPARSWRLLIRTSDLCPRCSSCLISSRLRRPSRCQPPLSGRRSCHLWTLSTGTTTTTWCRCCGYRALGFSEVAADSVPAALPSHLTVECREKLFLPDGF